MHIINKDSFAIQCPWCRQWSEWEEDIQSVCMPPIRTSEKIDNILDESLAKNYIFTCKNSKCFAPFESIICDNQKDAADLSRAISPIAWQSPRRFRLRKNSNGETHEKYICILFNRKPLTRWKDIHISELMDIRIIRKFLTAFTVYVDAAVTLFEAWPIENEKGEKDIFWIPIQPLEADTKNYHQYRETCKICRKIFKESALNALANDSLIKKQCPYYKYCPAEHACEIENHPLEISERCLRLLFWNKQYSVCYQSDIQILESMMKKWKNNDVDIFRPHKEMCWTKYDEYVYPVVIHGHLTGAIVTGQYDTDLSPKNVDDIIKNETNWLQARESSCGSLLENRKDKLKDAFDEVKKHLSDKQELIDGIEELVKLLNDLYFRYRYLVESTFRQECTGTITNHIVAGSQLASFLPNLFMRMAYFWAFKEVFLCVMSHGDQELYAYLTSENNNIEELTVYITPDSIVWANESIQSKLILPNKPKEWSSVIDEIVKNSQRLGSAKEEFVFLVIVHIGSRCFIFGFSGRNKELLSPLPTEPDFNTLRLSEECRHQLLRSCEQIAVQLHGFWQRTDQEYMFRILSHTLRTPAKLMKNGIGKLRYLIAHKYKTVMCDKFPEVFTASQFARESMEQGSKVLNDQLTSLSAAANLDELLKLAKDGQTDLIQVIDDIKPQYEWRTNLAQGKRSHPVKWDFHMPDGEAFVKGHSAAIILVIHNILENAIKYTYQDRTIHVWIQDLEDYWQLKVENQGVPLFSHEVEKAWRRNYRGQSAASRAKKSEEGTGYGLYIVKQIVYAAGGQARIETNVNSNTQSEGKTTVFIEFAKP